MLGGLISFDLLLTSACHTRHKSDLSLPLQFERHHFCSSAPEHSTSIQRAEQREQQPVHAQTYLTY